MRQLLNREILPYRPCVGIALFNARREVFVGERIDTPGAWQMPQGGIDEGEDIAVAALRELREETGCTSAKIIRIETKKIRYELPDDTLLKLWNGRYRGQEQTWVAAEFLGYDSEIDIKAFEPAEFTAWKWVPLPQTVDIIVPFKRETYRSVIRLFEDLI